MFLASSLSHAPLRLSPNANRFIAVVENPTYIDIAKPGQTQAVRIRHGFVAGPLPICCPKGETGCRSVTAGLPVLCVSGAGGGVWPPFLIVGIPVLILPPQEEPHLDHHAQGRGVPRRSRRRGSDALGVRRQ